MQRLRPRIELRVADRRDHACNGKVVIGASGRVVRVLRELLSRPVLRPNVFTERGQGIAMFAFEALRVAAASAIPPNRQIVRR